MKNAPLILAVIAGGLAVISLIWPNSRLDSVAILLLAIALVIPKTP